MKRSTQNLFQSFRSHHSVFISRYPVVMKLYLSNFGELKGRLRFILKVTHKGFLKEVWKFFTLSLLKFDDFMPKNKTRWSRQHTQLFLKA